MPNKRFGVMGRSMTPRAIATGLIVVAFAFAACSPAGSPAASTPAGSQPAGSAPVGGTDPDAALAELATKVLSTGPFGEEPTSPADLTLTPDEIARSRR